MGKLKTIARKTPKMTLTLKVKAPVRGHCHLIVTALVQFTNNKALRKKEKKKQIKAQQEKNTVVENSELLSKEQLKKIAKNPTNNIRVSGKRKRKMLKRLRHAKKETNQMDVEVASGSGTNSKRSKVKDTAVMDIDEEMSDSDDMTPT